MENQAQANYELERSAKHEVRHTATPWHIERIIEVAIDGGTSSFASIEADGFFAGGGIALVHIKPSEEISANAEFIVRACNAYQGLVDALHTIGAQSLGEDWTAEQAIEFVKQHARAALALAKE